MEQKKMAERGVRSDLVDSLLSDSRQSIADITGRIMPDRIKSIKLIDYGGKVSAPFGGLEYEKECYNHGFSCAIIAKDPDKLSYYRLRYREETETDWHDFSEEVNRHFVEELPGNVLSYLTYRLGPYLVRGKHLYRFKPHNPPDPSISRSITYWSTDDWFADIYSGFIKRYDLSGNQDISARKFKIKLEIYDRDGNQVTPEFETFKFIVSIGTDADNKTVLTRLANTDPFTGPVEVEDGGFVFSLRIDNLNCTAIIDMSTIRAFYTGYVCNCMCNIPASTQVLISF